MAEEKNTNLRYSQVLQEQIDAFRRNEEERFITGAIRQLLKLGIAHTPAAGNYFPAFEATERTVRRALKVEVDIFNEIKTFSSQNDLSYENAFVEFICRGLEASTGKRTAV